MLHNLVEELGKRGHDITLFASGDSETSAKLIPVVEQAIWLQRGIRSPHAPVIRLLKELFDRFYDFNLIHNHFNTKNG